MAFLAGYGLSKLPVKYAYILLILISIEGIANQQNDFFIKKSERYKLTLENITNRYVPKDELIVINGGQSPQEIYFAHRKGWTVDNKSINTEELRRLHKSGASYLILDKQKMGAGIDYYPMIFSDTNYAIYKLKILNFKKFFISIICQ